MLHGGFGILDPDQLPPDANIIYLHRKTEKGIPPLVSMTQASAIMPNYFLVGSYNTKVLDSIILTMTEVRLFKYKFSMENNEYFLGVYAVDSDPVP